MSFPFNLYLCAFAAAALSSALSFPLWKKWCEWSGHMDDPGHRKIHSERTPLAGGPAVMTGIFLPLAAGALLAAWWQPASLEPTLRELLSYGFTRRGSQLLAILAGAFGMVLLGWIDDRRELKPLPKFGGQIACALLIAWSGIRITLFIQSEPVNYCLTVLWILTVTNALNFLDNMNGLCGGLGFITAWACAWAAAIQGQYLVALLGFLTSGALLGFIPFNFPNARAFLGDSGSHLVGFLAAILSILPNFYSKNAPHPLAVLTPLLILAVPFYDLASVILIRVRSKKPVYVGDTNHISHRLVRRGLSRVQAVLVILLAHALMAALALSILARG
jgi:UDP-GlcNAc:undecaprenyl-phosphate GlcNAc-1-phosphate transferase